MAVLSDLPQLTWLLDGNSSFPCCSVKTFCTSRGFFFPDKVLIKDANEARYTNLRADG